jgi:glutamyl-tRNA synthetase
MSWDSIWAFNKKFLDPTVPRYMAISADNACKVAITNAPFANGVEYQTKSKHPKNPNAGQKSVALAANLLIEQEDAKTLVKDEKVTFMGWGNAFVRDITTSNGNNCAFLPFIRSPRSCSFIYLICDACDNAQELSRT